VTCLLINRVIDGCEHEAREQGVKGHGQEGEKRRVLVVVMAVPVVMLVNVFFHFLS
jgi:hypothetical protein